MGSTSFLNKPKSSGYKNKSGSSIGSDKEMNGKLRRQKIRRPNKMTDYGMKRIPDYTELAYKEAVSKLRYFFSGNYAPSVRSFGSPSIKNLDESDGDLDKKYPMTLAEYKPRPRLTAKYTTLYADSLNNATQPRNINAVPPAPAPAADLSGGTNPDVVNFIQKQEEYIEQLERESQYCRDELNNLLGKVKEVISENENLHEAQKNKIISRMFHSYAGSETDDLDDLGDSTGLDSDNKATPSKSRRSAKVRSTRLEGPNIVFESRISELEAQLAQAKIDAKKIQDENNENKRKLASGLVDSTCLDGFKRQIDNLQRDKSSLESQISKLKMSLEQRDLNELDGRQSRSDHELQLRDQRDRLDDEVRRLKEDLAKERSKSRSLAGEGARRALQERSAAEQRYTAHCDELQRDLAAQYDNLAKLQLELERQRREENDLKREISMKNAAIDDLKMDLKNKTSSLQADLAQAYAEKASLEEELASARLAIERQQRQAKHETNRLNSEIQSLRQRLDRADADVVLARRDNLRLTDQLAHLEKEINLRNLTPMSPEKKKKEKEISSMLENMDNKHAKTVAELESMIHSQNSLMEKLTGECRVLTDKLDDANRRHKEQLATLHRQVDYLTVSLQPTQTNAPNAYEAHTPHQTTTDRTVPHASTTGRDYTGSDTTGYSQIRGQPVTSIPDVREDRRDRNDYVPSRRVSKQNSRTSLLSQEPNANETKPFENTNITPANYLVESPPKQDENVHENDYAEKENKDQDEKEKSVESSEYERQNYSDQEYTQRANEYPRQPDYQDPDTTENAYQNKEYDQPAYAQQDDYPEPQPDYTQEQPEYTQEPQEYAEEPQKYAQEPQDFTQHQEGYVPEQADYTQEQYENYEQYPQQYADPNAQYDPQAYDQNYAPDTNYDQTQYNQNYTDETQVQPKIESTNIQQTTPENQPKPAQEKTVKSDIEGSVAGRNGKSSSPKGKISGKS